MRPLYDTFAPVHRDARKAASTSAARIQSSQTQDASSALQGESSAAQDEAARTWQSLVWAHAQDRNAHGSVYGGHTLHHAYALAHAAAQLHTGKTSSTGVQLSV